MFELLLVGVGKNSGRILAAVGLMLVILLPEMTCPVSGFVRVRPGTPDKSPLAHAVGMVWVAIRGFWSKRTPS